MSLPAAEPFAPDDVQWSGVSPRLATGRRLVAAGGLAVLTVLVLAVPLLAGAPLAALAALVPLAALAWVWWLIGRQVAALGYAEREEDLLVRRGVMFRELVVVPYGRLQFVDVTAGPLARKLGYSTVQLHTASPGTDATISGLAPEEAARLRDRLARRGEARLAGL